MQHDMHFMNLSNDMYIRFMTEPEDIDAIASALARLRGRGRGGHGPGRPGEHHFHDGHGRGGGRSPLAGPWGTDAARTGGPARMRLLEALAAASHPLSVSEVGDAIGVDQPRASRLIQQAVEFGFVRREADPNDARRTRVALTDEGARLARGFRGQRREHVSEALTGFTAEERTELARLLTKLADGWPHR